MKLLVINPNTTRAMTDAVVTEVARYAGPEIEVRGVTASFGSEVIASRETFATGAQAALEMCRSHANDADAVILACFGDPGLEAMRRVSPVPVVGLAQASIREAEARGGPWAIVTAGAAWAPMLQETVAYCGAEARFTGVVVLQATGLDVAKSPDLFRSNVTSAVREAVDLGAKHVILGGAGFAGMASSLEVDADLIDCIRSATNTALAVAAVAARKA